MPKSSPAVSQLAGEIARLIRGLACNYFRFSPKSEALKLFTSDAEEIISAALSGREEKIKELIASTNGIMRHIDHDDCDYGGHGPNGDFCVCRVQAKARRLRAALSALGESK